MRASDVVVMIPTLGPRRAGGNDRSGRQRFRERFRQRFDCHDATMSWRAGTRPTGNVRAARVAVGAGLVWVIAAVLAAGTTHAVPADSVDHLLPGAAGHKLTAALGDDPGGPAGDRFERAAAAVGPLFPHGVAAGHTCTASVVRSTSGDLILTAAHCVAGTGADWVFAPGFDDGATPEGTWTVTGAYVEPGWASGQDPDADIAVLRVAPRHVDGRLVTVQDVAGSNPMGTGARPGTTITDVAYNAGSDTTHVCTARVYRRAGVPAFDCDGFAGGSSGSPWLAPDADGVLTVRGLIGGLNQGGCSPSTSFSSPIDAGAIALLRRADAGGPGDSVPPAGASGC